MLDPEADDPCFDRFLDQCLDEELGGRRPPDLRDRLLRATAQQRAAAAATVARAGTIGAGAAWRRVALPAAALAVVVFALRSSARPAASPATDPVASTTPLSGQSVTALLDEFHRVMPREPVALRDLDLRRRLAPTALPVLRALIDALSQDPQQPLASRADEFRIFALLLDDPATATAAQARADAGDRTARLLLDTVAVIAAADTASRATALSSFEPLLVDPPTNMQCAVQCLLVAADLNPAEAHQLAAACDREDVAQRFRMAAALANTDPRRLLGKPLTLAGRLHDGTEFSTANWRGDVVLACFWASWCGPCAQVVAEVAAVAARCRADGLRVVGISCDHDREQLAQYLTAHPEQSWPQLFDDAHPGWHELAYWCGVRSIPSLFLIDRSGVVRSVNGRDDLEHQVRRLLAQ